MVSRRIALLVLICLGSGLTWNRPAHSEERVVKLQRGMIENTCCIFEHKIQTEEVTFTRSYSFVVYTKDELDARLSSVATRLDSLQTQLDTSVREVGALRTLLSQLRSEILARIDGIPMELTKDERSYGALKERLRRDFSEVFAPLKPR
jgi:hypothetical protein